MERLAAMIPPGQPILVGHHSERRARRDAQRIENGMKRAVMLFERAEYWEERARSALLHAKYKERPDVRWRRIKKIEKQALFVAPAWTPGREDVLLSLAGEIEDEDSTLAERQEARAERFTGYSGKRASESAQALDEVERLAAMIPPGQPILVGHHSERRARRDAQRIENGMKR
ncbi:DUF3560 domain-containing protein, partial [Escherichia coli]